MKLYLVMHDSVLLYVPAEDFTAAIAAWKRDLLNRGFTADEPLPEPESVQLIADPDELLLPAPTDPDDLESLKAEVALTRKAFTEFRIACGHALWGDGRLSVDPITEIPAEISLLVAAKGQLALQVKDAIAARMHMRAELSAMQAELVAERAKRGAS